MNVGKIEFNASPEIQSLEYKVRRLRSCIRWYRAFVAQSAPIKSKTLIYLAQRAEEDYRSAE